ncbi:phage tail protein [Paenibacillus lentus]|uniref:phage tail protein n=1 Tax=Paenibacillus lentus TaxID=1338368 RepID=UPI00364EF774
MDVDHIEVPTASLTEAGIVQLSNATNSTSEAQAATSKAVKSAYDAAAAAQTTANAANSAAAAAFQLGNERKAEVVAALVAWGISASTSESWDSLLSKMTAIINRGAQVITPGTTNKVIPAGYHNGSGYVVGDPDLVAANFPKDVNLFGIQGALERVTTAEKTAIANAIASKGVPASVSDSNTVLANKINTINTAKYASGTVSTYSHKTFTITGSTGATESSACVTITGIGFVPFLILVRLRTYRDLSIYSEKTLNLFSSDARLFKTTDTGPGGGGAVSSRFYAINRQTTTFDIPVMTYGSGLTWEWEAFG